MAKIDLTKYNLRTDLIIEKNETGHIEEEINGIKIKRTKDKGNYITILFEDVTNFEDREKIGNILEEEIKKLLKENNIKDSDECMIIGLGNELSTPDSLGVKTLKDIVITKHLFKYSKISKGIRKVSGFTPGVMASTGMETSSIIKAIIDKEKPNFIIAIDSLASRNIERINKTIQLTDTGIHPGSGIGNNRQEISYKTLNIPVIAIGIPTVVSASTIVIDTLDYLEKHIAYIKENEAINKLSFQRTNYLDKIKNHKLTEKESNDLFGLFGSLSNYDKKELINEVLTNINLNLIVTSTEIDFLINKLANILSSSLNNSLHKNINHY